jgi:hypothetical protein
MSSAQYPNRSLTDVVSRPEWNQQRWRADWRYPSSLRPVSFSTDNESYQQSTFMPVVDDPDRDW